MNCKKTSASADQARRTCRRQFVGTPFIGFLTVTAILRRLRRASCVSGVVAILSITLLYVAPYSYAADTRFQSHASIAKAAEAAASQQLPTVLYSRKVKAQAVDPRLKLRACAVPLSGELPSAFSGSPRITVEVSCRDEQPWKIYVPVGVHETDRVIVTTRSLPRGAQLSAEDFSVEERTLERLQRGYLREGDQAEGMRLRRSVSAGQVLTPSLIEQQTLIKRGQRVTLIANMGSVKVAMEGIALSDGARGQRIKVRNMSSEQELEAIVRSQQTVEVLLR